jgi:hypothetical protein
VQEHRGEREVEGDVEVGVGEDDVGVLAAELEGYLLHRAGRRSHQPPTGLQAPGERDQVDARVGRERRAGGRAGAEDEVPDARGQARLLEQPHEVDRAVRGELAGLEDEGVAGGQARRDLPGDLQQRVVPRGDQRADSHRLVHDAADDVRVPGVDHPAGVLGGHPAVVAEDRDHVGDVVLALHQALAGVEGLHPGDVVGVALQQVGHRQQQVPALARRRVRPRPGQEGAVRGGDRGLGVLRPGLVDLGDRHAVGRAPDLAARSGPRARPRAVEVELSHLATYSLRGPASCA